MPKCPFCNDVVSETKFDEIIAVGECSFCPKDKQKRSAKNFAGLYPSLSSGPIPKNPAERLSALASLYAEKHTAYGDNFLTIGNIFTTLFPNGIHLTTSKNFNDFHLFTMLLVKLTRYAHAMDKDLPQQDSLDDLSVYAQMLAYLQEV